MNQLMKLSLLVGLMFFSAGVMGRDKDFSVSIGEVKQKTIRFGVSNARNVSLYIYNGDKGEVFSDKIINLDSVEKSYNMSDMASGTYYLVAESDSKIEKYKITVDEKQVLIDHSPISAITKPEYTINKNIVKLKMSDVTGNVKVSISDTANNTYYNNP